MNTLAEIFDYDFDYDNEIRALGYDPKRFKTQSEKIEFLLKKAFEFGIISNQNAMTLVEEQEEYGFLSIYGSVIPFHSRDHYLDLDLFIRTGKVKYYTLDDRNDEDEDDIKFYLYILPNGNIIEHNDLKYEVDPLYIFTYPAVDFYVDNENLTDREIDELTKIYYDDIKNILNKYVESSLGYDF